MSEDQLIGIIYSQLLEEFGFGYSEKDLWMIAENIAEKIVNQIPQLNDNQQIVLQWLKLTASTGKPMQVVFWMMNNAAWGHIDKLRDSLMELTDKEQFEVLAAFAQWGLEQEEAG
ncbi:hypothetical protein [Enterococcus durans]|uniref:hypothetical protein n=1 Tax=Enterococcus durans TaxID=53345 RepID=UPI0039A73CB7